MFHAGDGNLHPLILYDANQPGEQDRAEAFGADILRLCVEVGGVLTGEHGVGIEKRDLMPEMFSDIDLNQQQRLEMRVRRDRSAQSRQGVSDAASLRRTRPHACARRQIAVPGYSAVLNLVVSFSMHEAQPLTVIASEAKQSSAEHEAGLLRRCAPRNDGLARRTPTEGRRSPVDTLKVRDAQEVEDAVRAAIANEQPLEIIGHGTKRRVGQPMATNALLDLSALNAVVAYEPNELIITVQAGAPLADVMSLIDSRNQQFAFEPMHTALLLGTAETEGTIGGMIGAGLAGPRRIKSGGARDHLLGAHAVSGFGDSFKAGGKVVKNVTGYDLCKLLAGSWGTLAVMTEVTLKVTPRPESERTLLLRGLDDVAANQAMTAALGSPYDVSGRGASAGFGAAHHRRRSGRDRAAGSGADAAAARGHHLVGEPSRAVAARGAEQFRRRRADRRRSLRRAVACGARRRAVRGHRAPRALWPVWRIVCPPASGGAFGQALQRESGGEVIYDWGGGLIWAALPPAADAHAKALRQRVDEIGGHASLIRGADEVRARHRRVPAAAERARRARAAGQEQLRSEERSQSRPDVARTRSMKTEFSLTQLADPDIAEADKILRACVHCGFCTATCPTYVLLGDELDSPRGRIYLIKEMLESNAPPTADVVKHIDRCLSCLACMTTCPSGVNYMHLVDQARARIEKDYTRPFWDRLIREVLSWMMPHPGMFRIGMWAARIVRPIAALLPGSHDLAHPTFLSRIKAMLALAPKHLPEPGTLVGNHVPGDRAEARPGRAAARLRPAGAGAAHQSRCDQSADPPRHRGRAGRGRGLLRCADPSSRPRHPDASNTPVPTSRRGKPKSPAAVSTPFWSRPPAAAR